jgi:hypothetical protein
MDFEPVLTDGTSQGAIRFFRNTNTSGINRFYIYAGDGAATLNHQFAGQGTNSFVCANNGNFGVGTASPDVTLHLEASSARFRIQDSDSSGDAATPYIDFYDNDTVGRLGYMGFASGSNSDISIANTTATGDIKLLTNSTNRMIIDGATGDAYFTEMLGVGVSPSTAFHVSASSMVVRLQDSDSSGVTANPRIDFYDSSSRIGYVGFGSTSNNDLFYLAETGGGMSFRTNGNNERMRIESTGEVTIGTELDVDNININGNTISSSNSNGDLILTPNGTGDLVLDGVNWPQADGSADQVLKTDGAGQTSWATISTLTGDIVQIVEATDTTGATTTALMNLDNTIPQNTEGTEFITQAITPTDSSNTLLIEFWSPLIGNLSTAYFGLAALFQDSTADALVGAVCNTGYSSSAISIKYKMTAGTTSSTTFKIRFGTTNASGAAAMNILGGGGLFSTAGRAYLRITEVAV